MDEKDRELTPDTDDTTKDEAASLGAEDGSTAQLQPEDNDDWKFDAEAPTLDDTVIDGTEFEIEVPDVKEIRSQTNSKATAADTTAPKPATDFKALKITTGCFLILAIIAVLVVFGVRYYTIPNGKEGEMMNPGSVALTVGDTDVSIGMYNYYYTCIVQNYEQYASYGYYDLDTSTDYSKQYTTNDDGDKISWAQKFQDDAIDQIQYITAYYESAIAAGEKLSSEQKKTIKTQLTSLESSAKDSDTDVNSYIAATYGDYCSYDTLNLMLKQCYIAENYYQKQMIDTNVTEDEFNKYFKDNESDYEKCAYAFIEMTYDATNDSTKAKSVATAQSYLKKIKTVDDMKTLIPEVCADLISQYVDYGYFSDKDEAAKNLEEYVEDTMTAKDSTYDDTTTKWLFNDDTAVGSTTYYIDEDNSLIYLLLKTGEPQLDDAQVYSVRHILITPDGSDESTDGGKSSDTQKTYTDAQWATAKQTADTILADFEKGDKTEVSFAELAESKSDDTESTSAGSSGLYGGLYEGVTKGQMVAVFEDWALDKSRKYGDTGIVKSEYGYHIMYFEDACPQYEYDCKADIKKNKENEFTKSYKIDKHKSVMAKTKVATPSASDSNE